MTFEYRYFFKYTYDKHWQEVLKEDYEHALTLKKLWKIMSFEAKKVRAK